MHGITSPSMSVGAWLLSLTVDQSLSRSDLLGAPSLTFANTCNTFLVFCPCQHILTVQTITVTQLFMKTWRPVSPCVCVWSCGWGGRRCETLRSLLQRHPPGGWWRTAGGLLLLHHHHLLLHFLHFCLLLRSLLLHPPPPLPHSSGGGDGGAPPVVAAQSSGWSSGR